MTLNKKVVGIGLWTVISFVIANMVGTGVFTSLGFQLAGGIDNTLSVLCLWFCGGILAFCGALVYGELGSTMPRSGGEYHYLTKIYHPSLGFLSGWVSLTVGFSAPVAMACMAMASYICSIFPALNPTFFALSVLSIITIVHSFSVKIGGSFQNLFTFFKVALIFVFVICGLILTPQFQPISIDFSTFSFSSIFSSAFAVSLIYVTYAFSGWNAAGYIAGEMKNPQKNLPKSLFISTAFVSVAYLALNFVFLLTAPKANLMGQVEVGKISADYIFGTSGIEIFGYNLTGGFTMGLLISILLISTISAMVFVGPRVSQVMGEDYKILKPLAIKTSRQVPIVALWFQFSISFILIITSTFEKVITYAGFTLNIFTLLAVAGIFVHRIKYPNIERPFKTWGYPVVPAIYSIVILWISYYLLTEKTTESLLGLTTIAIGLVIYFANNFINKNKQQKVN